MKFFKIFEIVKAVKAIDYNSGHRFEEISKVTFDSRLVEPNTLFVPLVGGRTDGHDYVDKAISNGATAVLWSRNVEEAPKDICVIQVDDTLQAFQDLAHYYRQLIGPKVVGITGSNGKTTTKDMLASVLATTYKVHKTEGNYNNAIGLPQTIMDMPEETDILVLEMGMSDFGEIERLSEIAAPDIAIITIIGESHIEFLGSRAGIAKAKDEIILGMTDQGVLVYPENEPLIRENLPQKPVVQLKTFGSSSSADLYSTEITLHKRETTFKTSASDLTFTIPVLGAYNVQNALSVIVVARLLNVLFEDIKDGLASFKLTKNRNQWLVGPNGSNILDDAYNASPTSMGAILDSFQETNLEQKHSKANTRDLVVVLGDMRELGANSKAYHEAMAAHIEERLIRHVYLYGVEMAALYDVLKQSWPENKISYFKDDQAALVNALNAELKGTDDVLVKSSLGTGLINVVKSICNLDETSL